jgi:hypothetical protein
MVLITYTVYAGLILSAICAFVTISDRIKQKKSLKQQTKN